MSDDDVWKRAGKKTYECAEGFVKGSKAYHATTGHNYKIRFNTSKSCKVNVMEKATNIPVFRLDKAHGGVNPKGHVNHININPKFSKIKPDPHPPLGPGGLAAGTGAARVAKIVHKVNKVAVPLAIAIDTVQIGISVYDDIQQGTTRNTVETAATVAGGWAGGYGGAVVGAAAGTAICPGLGTIVGGIIGGLTGGIGGSMGAGAIVETIGDDYDYDIIRKKCKKCGKEFKVRQYRGQKNIEICPKCS